MCNARSTSHTCNQHVAGMKTPRCSADWQDHNVGGGISWAPTFPGGAFHALYQHDPVSGPRETRQAPPAARRTLQAGKLELNCCAAHWWSGTTIVERFPVEGSAV